MPQCTCYAISGTDIGARYTKSGTGTARLLHEVRYSRSTRYTKSSAFILP